MKIDSFSGEHRWLSNFEPCKINAFGYTYQSVEHAYVAAKSTVSEHHLLTWSCDTPGQAKRLGREVELRTDWEEVRLYYMRTFLEQKFSPGSELRAKLDATKGIELIEGNHWGDTFWGVCNGVGKNNLGLLLMAIRDDISLLATKEG